MPPGSQPLRRAMLAVLLVVAVGAVAVAVTEAPESDDEPANESFPSGANIAAQYTSLDGFLGTMQTVTVRGNETNTTTQLIKTRPGTAMQYVRRINGSEDGPDIVVSNGTVTWEYDRRENTVTRLNASYRTTANRGEYIQRLFVRLDRTQKTPKNRDSSTATPGVAPVPQVPQGGDVVRVGGNASDDRFGVTYEGRATIAGRDAYVLQVRTDRNASEQAGNFTQTLWIDTEYYTILGHHIEGTVDGERFMINATFLNASFNPGLTDDTFTFEPPADATVESSRTPLMETYDSVAALQADTELPVPRPDLPRDFAFSVGRRLIFEDGRLASSRYVNATSTLTVTTFNRTIDAIYNDTENRTDGETVQVGDQEGTYRTYGLSKTVSWSCAGRGYSVRGSGVTRELLLRVAASVECA